MDPLTRERLDETPEVVDVARQEVYAVDDDGVALADESEEPIELGPPNVLAGGLVVKTR